jgi:hypothetical protein
MSDPRQDRATGLPVPWYRLSSRQRWRQDVSAAIAALFLCTGLVLMPALTALDLTVGIACRDLDRAGCIALFQPPSE